MSKNTRKFQLSALYILGDMDWIYYFEPHITLDLMLTIHVPAKYNGLRVKKKVLELDLNH